MKVKGLCEYSKRFLKAYVLIVLVLGCVNLPGAWGVSSADDTILDFEGCGNGVALVDYGGIAWDEGWSAYDVTEAGYIDADTVSGSHVAASHIEILNPATYDRLGFDFPSMVVFVGAWFSGASCLGEPIDPATSVELIGYVDSVPTFFSGVRSLQAWDGNSYPITFIELNWPGVDRVEVIPYDEFGGAGYFAMDNLRYRDSGTPGAYAGGVPGTQWPHTKRYSVPEGSETTVLDAGLSYDPDGDPLEYRWDIGEDGTWDTGWSVEPILSRTFTSSTSFVVEVSDGVNTDWDRAYVDYIESTPEAGFTWSPDPPQADVEIQFTDTSFSFPDEIVAWSWDFGDGSTSNEQNPIHAYDSAGTYTVTLTVTDEDGDTGSTTAFLNLGAISLKYVYINFQDCDPWTELTEYKGITFDTGWYAVGQYHPDGELYWTNTEYGVAAGNFDEDWDFFEDPSVTTTYGLDFPCLVTVDLISFSRASTIPFIWVFPGPSPDYVKVKGYREGELAYETGYHSLPELSSDNFYPSIGIFPMGNVPIDRLEIEISEPGFFSMRSLYLRVKDPPVATFTWSPDPPQTDIDIQFTDTSFSFPDEIVAWSWDFGDGSTSNEQNPIHAYDSAGTYTVTLTVTDEDGFTDHKWATFSLMDTPYLHDNDDGDWAWSTTYSDPISITLSMTDDASGLHPLPNQAGEPKTVYLEYFDGTIWNIIDEDVLSDPGDADSTLVFTFDVQEGEAMDVAAGDYPIRFRFEGDSLYGGLTQPGTLTVLEETPLVLDADDGDWEWETTYSDEITITLEMMDDDLENLYHQLDAPKAVRLERCADPYWFLVASDVLEDPASGDSVLGFTFTPGASGLSKGANTVRFVFDGDSRYLGKTVGGTINLLNTPPVANNMVVSTDEDKPVSFTLDYGDVDDPVCDLVPTIVAPPEHGELDWGLPGDEEFHAQYTPDPDWYGTDSFTFRVTDLDGAWDDGVVTITVNSVDDIPVAYNDQAVTQEDTPITIDVLANDDGLGDGILQLTIETPPAHGIVQVEPDNKITYSPSENYFGGDSFEYEVEDVDYDTSTGIVEITVLPVNDPPWSNEDELVTDEDTPTSFTLDYGDVDDPVCDLVPTLVTPPEHGELDWGLPGDEEFHARYTPDPDWYGTDSFTYKVFDGEAYSNVATVTITVNPVNDPPVAEDDSVTTDEDTAVSYNVLSNDHDVDLYDVLQARLITAPSHAESFTLYSDGWFEYVPEENYDSRHPEGELGYDPDSFTYEVFDGEAYSNVATVYITVLPVNDPPVADDQEAETDEDTSVIVTLDCGDVDVRDYLTLSITNPPEHGQLEVKKDKEDDRFRVRYTPDPDYNGFDSFTYEVVDEDGASDAATVYITVNPVNDLPIAADDFVTTDEDTPVGYNVLDNDADVETVFLSVNLLTDPTHAESFTLDSDGWFSYSPEENYDSQHPEENDYIPDSFTYEVVDADGASDAATVYITVYPVNDPPEAEDQEAVTDEDTSVIVTLDCGDVDVRDYLTLSITNPPEHGQLEILKRKEDDPFRVRYTPNPNYNGLDWVTYTVTDPDGAWDEATVTITVNPVNDPPVATLSQPPPVDEGTETTLDASASYDVDGDEIEYRWDLDGDGVWEVDWSTSPTTSHIYFDDGAFEVSVEVRDVEYSDVDTVTVTVTDLAPAAEFIWTPEPHEGSPVAFVDASTSYPDAIALWSWDFAGLGTSTDQSPSFTFMDNGFYTVTLTVTDEDGSTDTVSHDVTILDLSPVASFTWSPDPQAEGSSVYFTDGSTSSPDAIVGWSWDFASLGVSTEQYPEFTFPDDGTYTVTLTATDEDGSTDTISHTVTVDNVAPSVEAGPDKIVNEGDSVDFSGSFTDPGADTWTFEWTFGDGNEATGTLTPNHAYGDNGVYTVTLTVEDEDGGVGTDTLTVTVLNVPPTADAGPDMADEENTPLTFTGLATDPGTGDTHTYEWDFDYDFSTFDADHSGQEVAYTWTDDWEGTVALRVTDDDGGWDVDTLHVTISNVAPEAHAGEPQTADEGATVAFSGSASDQSPDDTLSYTWDFGDGSPVASGTLSPEHVYADDGTYTVALTVDDDDEGTTTCTTTVTVINVAPTVDAGEDQNVYVGEMVQFNGQFSDPGDDTHTITWEFGDGGSETGTLEPTHVYASGGDHLVTLTVTDDDGGVGSDTLTVHALKIHAAVDFDPDTLNLKSGGNYVTCYIELQEGFTVDMIDPSTVVLNGEVPAEPKPVNVGDHDEDGVPDLMVKFSRTILELLLEPGEAEITVTGELYNGLVFDGGDKVTVIAPGNEKPKHRVVVDGEVYGEFKEVKVKQGKKSATIILEGGTIYSPFTQWIAAAEADDPYTLDGEITIISEGEETSEWSFHRAFPLKWEGPAFDSSSTEPQLVEAIELAIEKVIRAG